MVWVVTGGEGSTATLTVGEGRYDALIGRSGCKDAADKREGDGATPLGVWRVLYGMYRADRGNKPQGALPWMAIEPDMGWCDAPEDPLYNQMVPVGYPASHEVLWRQDAAYDYVLVLDHNQPAMPGLGSAVFVHVWRDGATHTAGCVALKKADLLALVEAGAATVEIR